MKNPLTLVDWIAQEMQCTYVSDLKYLTPGGRHLLARKLSQLPASQASLQDWLDASQYLTDSYPQGQTPEALQQALIAYLRR